MISYFPIWISDTATICSITSLVISIYLIFGINKIKRSFLRKARLPEVLKDLTEANKKLSKNLKDWKSENKYGIEQLIISKGLLKNLKEKLPDNEKKIVARFIKSLEPKKYLLFKEKINNISSDEAWEFYSELSGLITSLEQLKKDSRWE